MTEKPSEIRCAADLASFIRSMHADLLASPEKWENRTLSTYLEALSAVVDSYEQGCINMGEPIPPVEVWQSMAGMLGAATIYE
ncbi:MAG: hypothetical protein KGS45_06995 [Planctomycetes bacterium]|nr:hypothetical protein [Planctomycetota bacterium]